MVDRALLHLNFEPYQWYQWMRAKNKGKYLVGYNLPMTFSPP